MSLERTCIFGFFLFLFVFGLSPFVDPDLWWHLAAGRQILNQGLILGDTFSYTFSGKIAFHHEWLAEALMYAVYRSAGLTTLTLLFAALTVLAFALVYANCAKRPLLAVALIAIGASASQSAFGVRPQILTLVFAALWMLLLDGVRQKRIGIRAFWVFPCLTVLWVNLHAGFALGIVLLLLYAVCDSLQRRQNPGCEKCFSKKEIFYLLLTALGCAAASVVNPHGLKIWPFLYSALNSGGIERNILEWAPVHFTVSRYWPFGILGIFGILAWIGAKKRPSISESLLFWGSACLGLSAERHIALFAVLGLPALSRVLDANHTSGPLSKLFEQRFHQASVAPLKNIMGILVLSAMLLFGMRAAGFKLANLSGNILTEYPVWAVRYLKASGMASAKGFHDYDWGGYLIWQEIPVFVDGRANGLYPRVFLERYFRMSRLAESWESLNRDYGFAYALVRNGSGLDRYLARHPDWRAAYEDDRAVIYEPAGGRA